jgi:dihydroorotase/N-acyl-D-amino-acid deacylase
VTGGPIDVLIRGGSVVDGTGNPWFRGDVLLAGDRVLDVVPSGTVPAGAAGEVVDADGMVVCPGFIDILSHSIRTLMADGRCLSKVTQGVTTEIMGEAWTPGPVGGRIRTALRHQDQLALASEWIERSAVWRRFRDWLEALERRGVSPNIGSFLGGGTLREYAMGMDMGAADAADLATMRRVAEEAMREGAFGVSYALIYPPEAYAGTDEIVDVCGVVARRHGVYATHIRSEGDRLLEAMDEAIAIGRRADLPVEIYHLKAAGPRNWGRMHAVLETIERARERGLDITADLYPYTGAGTGLTAVLPPWVAAQGRLFDNLRDPDVRRRLHEELGRPSGDWEAMGTLAGPEGIMPIGFERPHNRPYAGMRLSDIAAARSQDWIDTVIELVCDEEQRIGTVYFLMNEDNLVAQLRQPWMKIATDAGGLDPAWAKAKGPVHPRAYGTYPRVLGRYAREQRVIGLEDAVRKMSSAVADRLGLRHRGLLRRGFFADVVVFDAGSISDRATFEAPHQLSVGVRDVWVNGVRVLRAGDHTAATPGRFLEGPGTG